MPAAICTTCLHESTDHSSLAGCLAPGCDCEKPPAIDNGPDGLTAGRALRDAGVAVVGSTAPGALVTAWRADAAKAMEALIQGGHPFTADDLVKRAGMPPRPNMLGGLFLGASRAKRIKPVGYDQATRPESHARVQRVWQASV